MASGAKASWASTPDWGHQVEGMASRFRTKAETDVAEEFEKSVDVVLAKVTPNPWRSVPWPMASFGGWGVRLGWIGEWARLWRRCSKEQQALWTRPRVCCASTTSRMTQPRIWFANPNPRHREPTRPPQSRTVVPGAQPNPARWGGACLAQPDGVVLA